MNRIAIAFFARTRLWKLHTLERKKIYVDVLDKIERERNIHLSRVKATQMKYYYDFWGALAFDSCFEAERAIWADQ